ncbi:exotoxin [Erwinia billingiae]|uniref:exotoxin n=1 Tax=Erwinia billingiae TaxID=182337 RepID=UPI003208E2D0
MILSRIKWDAVAIAALLLMVVALCITVKLQSSSKALLTQQNEQLKQEKTSAEAITKNVLKATALFNDIAQATHDDNQSSNSDSEGRVVIIRQAIKGDPCAAQPVPAAAADQLRANRNKIRSGATGTDTHKPAG